MTPIEVFNKWWNDDTKGVGAPQPTIPCKECVFPECMKQGRCTNPDCEGIDE